MDGNGSKDRHANDMLTSKGQKFINRSDCCASIIFALITIIGKKKLNASKFFYNALRTKVRNKIKTNDFNNVEQDTSKLFFLFQAYFLWF